MAVGFAPSDSIPPSLVFLPQDLVLPFPGRHSVNGRFKPPQARSTLAMTRKRRVSSKAPPASGANTPLVPASPAPSSSRHAVSVTTTPARSATPTHIKFDPSVLSPPLKKRMHTRSDARAVKIPPLEDHDDEYGDEERLDDGTLRHNIKPDPHLPDPYKRHAKVLQHKGSVYDAMLTRARVHQNQSEFIALQALEYGNQFYLWMRSGTIGLPGKTSLTGPYECHDKIVVEFCMVFSSKTCCAWDERHSLRYQEGSYTWIELDYSMGTPYADVSSTFVDSVSDCDDGASTAPSTSHDARGYKRRRKSASPAPSRHAASEWTLPSGGSSRTPLASLLGRADSSSKSHAPKFQRPASRLHAEVQAFLSLIADPSDYLSYSYSETEEVMEEAQKMPLGRLSKTTIKRGYETLQEIFEALRSRTAPRSQILNLSSHFYSIIPHHSRLELIDTMVKLGKKVAMMESVCENVRGMSSMEIATLCHQRNYLDECYELLECALHPLAEHSDEYARVKAYMRNSSCCGWKDGTLQLASVFRVSKPSEDRRFEPFRAFSNRKILWHGSRLSNWLGILSDGLRIAPPEVASNGRIFGKGVYFTDKASKAQAYCHASARHGGQSKCIFVLSEVALGDVKEMTASDEHAKQWVHIGVGGHAKASHFHSCKGVGTCRPDESGDVVDRDGAIWPLGKPTQATEATGLSHSEYIIYNPAQARMRYVVLAKSAY